MSSCHIVSCSLRMCEGRDGTCGRLCCRRLPGLAGGENIMGNMTPAPVLLLLLGAAFSLLPALACTVVADGAARRFQGKREEGEGVSGGGGLEVSSLCTVVSYLWGTRWAGLLW